MEATLRRNNQATIPKQVREYLKLKVGRSVQVFPSAEWRCRHLTQDSDIEAQRECSVSSTRPVSVEEMDVSLLERVQRSVTADDRARYQCHPAISTPGRPRSRHARRTTSSTGSCERIGIQVLSTSQRFWRLCGVLRSLLKQTPTQIATSASRIFLRRTRSEVQNGTAGLRSRLCPKARNWESLKMP